MYSATTNMVYVADTGPGVNGIAGGLVALSVQADCSLKVAWSQAVGTAVPDSPNSTPTLANGVVFVGVNDGSVSAFDAASGKRLWNSGSYGFAVYPAPMVANGMVFAGSWSGSSGSAAGAVRAWSVPTSPILGLSPKSLTFSATAGGANPAPQSVNVTNQGAGSLTFSATPNAGWLTVTPTTGSAPATLSVQPNISGLAAGTYTGTITVTPNSGAAQTISVTLTVTGQGLNTLLGDGNIESTQDDNAAGHAEAFPTTAVASGNLTQLRVYVDQGSAASNLVVGLYSNSSGRPAQLLTQGSLAHPTAGTWNAVTVPSAAVTSGTTYWIAILSPAGSGTLNFRDRSGGGTSVTSSSSSLTALPATWATGASWSSSNLSATGLG
jgi:outer membrane protein assembly factor BamB